MKTVAEIRRDNLIALAEEAGSMDAVAAKADTSAVYLSQIVNRARDQKTGRPRELGTILARRIEDAFRKPRGWMDRPPDLKASDERARYGLALADMMTTTEGLRDVTRWMIEKRTDLSPDQRARFLQALDKMDAEAKRAPKQ